MHDSAPIFIFAATKLTLYLKFDTSLGKNKGYLSHFQRFIARLYCCMFVVINPAVCFFYIFFSFSLSFFLELLLFFVADIISLIFCFGTIWVSVLKPAEPCNAFVRSVLV